MNEMALIDDILMEEAVAVFEPELGPQLDGELALAWDQQDSEQPELVQQDTGLHNSAGEGAEQEMRDLEPGLANEESPDNDATMDDADGVENDIGHRLHPIEVWLTPPSNRHEYRAISPAKMVERVLEEIVVEGEDDELLYSVEFDDGTIEQVTRDDIVGMNNGESAVESFRRGQASQNEHASLWGGSTKRNRKDKYDDSESFDSDSDVQPPKRHALGPVPLRRSTRQLTSSRHVSVENGLDDDEDLEDINGSVTGKNGLGPSRRQTRSSTAIKPNYTQPALSSDDELANGKSSGDDFVPVTSDLVTQTRSSARKRKSRFRHSQKFTHTNDRESSIEFESSTRRSGRANRNMKSMRVPDVEDDYDIVEDKYGVPKHVSVKEIFQSLPEGSEFAEFHLPVCETCNGKASSSKGPLIYCQGCSNSYHKVCLGQRSVREHRVTKIGQDSFVLQCRICVGVYKKKDAKVPDHARCQTCKLHNPSCTEFSTKKAPKQEEKMRLDNNGEDPITNVRPDLINNADSLLFRCTTCKRGYHFEHLPPMTKSGDIPEDLRAERLEEYSMVDWKCKDCVEADLKIHALVAWRPIDQSSYVAGQTCHDFTEDEKEYLVKWEGRSHFHDTWMPGAWVFGTAASAMRSSFNKRQEVMLPKMSTSDAIEEEWLLADVFLRVKYSRNPSKPTKSNDLARISDVKEVYVKFQGLDYSQAVWDTPPPRDSGAPWEAFCEAYREYVNGAYFEYVADNKMKERIAQYCNLNFAKECEMKQQPAGLQRGKLMEYQMEGLNWLLYNFHSRHNVILADEMGLGKTVQVVAFITALVQDKPNCWPFLIVVPNATCPNWRRELKQWAPELRVVTYHGGREAQDLSFRYELFPEGIKGGMKAHVVIMSYEAAVDARSTFRSVKWAGLVVDEGQRLKNEHSLLYLSLQDMRIPFRLLLTGTPLQNNKRELFNLLQFIDPSHDAQALDEKYAELTKENLPELHSLIRPYFLRRTKAQVLKFLPPMAQIILPVSMSVLQEKLCKSIIARNPELIKAIISKSKVKAGERKSLNNMLMDLRQCLCHPFSFSSDVEDRSITDPDKIHRNLVEASGKLMLLDIMLPKLKERGHRVLIFSQFLHSLTIIEDFLTGIGLDHARIDGSLSALEKQKRIDAFNAPDSSLFAMLLSTRAGGVGINLATADTVIIYDPDFNPHQDIQALSRAHRIGQKHKVLCFQLVTKVSAEEKIMEMGRKKMALDHALIEAMDAEDDAGDDLESILKHGAEALFGDPKHKAARIVYDDASVNKLLDRSQIENTDTGDDQSAEAQFSFARVWANDEGNLTANVDDDAKDSDAPASNSVWENILKQREEEHQRELLAKQQEYGRGARRRGTQGVHYDVTRQQDQDSANSDNDGGDELYIDGNEDESGNEEGSDDKVTRPPPPPKVIEPTPVPIPVLPPPKRGRGRPRKVPPEGTGNLPATRVPPNPRAPSQQAGQTPPRSHSKAGTSHLKAGGPRQAQRKPIPRPPQGTPQQQHQVPSNHATTPVPVPVWQYTTTSMPHRSPQIPVIPSQQVRPPQPTFKPNTGNTVPTPQPSQPTGTAKVTPNAATKGSSACFLCGLGHAAMSCVNVNSEMSLRLAIDSLRTSNKDPAFVQRTREAFVRRLRDLTQKGN